MAEAYYRKWRPLGWDGVIGQEHVIRTLRNAVSQGNIAHAYLFSGPRGTGKTSTARIVAKAANCLAEDQSKRPCNSCENCESINQARFLDLIEIDAASNTSVDDVRDLRERINFSPTKGRSKVYIIDEVHMLSNAAFNALLKTLEEPPAHAIFVLATTEVHKIPATVLSRCQRYEFRRIPLNIIQSQLKHIAESEGIMVETAALTAIARQATGSMRDGVSMLDQLASTGEEVTLTLTQDVLGTAANQSVFELIDALLKDDMGGGISIINHALDAGCDPRQYARQVVDLLRYVLMARMGNLDQIEGTNEEIDRIQAVANLYTQEKLLRAIRAFDYAAQNTNASWQPGLRLELATAHSLQTSGSSKPAVTTEKSHVPMQEKAKVTETPKRKVQKGKKPVISEADSEKKNEKAGDPSPLPENKLGHDTKIESTDVGNINARWKEIRDSAKEISPETAALLNSCRSVTIKRGRLVLGFASQVLSSKMENGQNIKNARTAIRNVTGADLEIDCRTAGKEMDKIPDDMDIETDGMVGEALSLGGKITKKESVDKQGNGK